MSGMHRSKSKHELKLLEKIPENAEATVVLVGEWGRQGLPRRDAAAFLPFPRRVSQAAWTSWSSPPWPS